GIGRPERAVLHRLNFIVKLELLLFGAVVGIDAVRESVDEVLTRVPEQLTIESESAGRVCPDGQLEAMDELELLDGELGRDRCFAGQVGCGAVGIFEM